MRDRERPVDTLVEQHLPASHAALQAASRGLFFSLPVAFDPAESVGPYLAIVDRDAAGQPYRFLDMGALIATQAFGENDPAIVRAVLESLPFVTTRYAHSEYQTVLSLRLKAALTRIAPAGTPRHFIVNTGAEAVENAIKSVLMNRVMTSPDGDGGFIVSFDGRVSRPHAGRARGHAPQEGAAGLPDVRLAAHLLSGRGGAVAEGDRPARGAQPQAVVGSARLRPAAARGEEQGHVQARDGRDRRIPAQIDASRLEWFERFEWCGAEVLAFVQAQRANLAPDVVRRSKRVAAVLVEPIQGEGGVRIASARFMRKLRLLTKIYDVPLVFDEVQTGWGMTGRLWAHELFDLPCPPDVVTWAKKAQNGVLFVSEELATFFQEEKKFNTTWEGDSVGMVRLLALLDKLDLEQVRRTGERARAGLEALAREHREICGTCAAPASCWRSTSCAPTGARRCSIARSGAGSSCCRPASARVRFYPRYDTEPSAIDEALSILRPGHRRSRSARRDQRAPADAAGTGGRRHASARSRFRSTRSRAWT